MTTERSQNFGFLADGHNPVFHDLALGAERAALIDPNATLVKLRQLGEAFAKYAASAYGVWSGPQTTQVELIAALRNRGAVDGQCADLFHSLRKAGNRATHEFSGSRQDAVDHLKLARQLAIWFHRTFGGPGGKTFSPGPFVPLRAPDARLKELEAELAQARAEVDSHRTAVAQAQELARLEAERRAAAEAAAQSAQTERAEWEKLAASIEADANRRLREFEASLDALQKEAERRPQPEQQALLAQAVSAAQKIDLDEEETRVLIDAQLRSAGWEVDSRELRFAKGARPEKGKARAIAEWPTASGPADYILFDGLTPLAVVEAKRKHRNVSAVIDQAERYSVGLRETAGLQLPAPDHSRESFPGWPASSDPKAPLCRVPFLYATNGKAHLRQHLTGSGTWFRDARKPTNLRYALDGWHSPATLRAMLERDIDAATRALETEPTDYLGLREYQLYAIDSVEQAIARGQRELLVAMATGTGKTKTIIGLIYRLLKAKRVRRVLFLVDRTSLGEQAQNAFKEMKLEGSKTFSEIYEVRELGDLVPEPETKVHVATVQSMARRIFEQPDDAGAVPIDRYDCVIVDESHRGYTLDKEMTEGEQELRSFTDFVSAYRRVLDHFDAIKIGLTATPALHTREIFGDAIYNYGYREAVIDGWLIDHEPPISIVTKLATEGIHFDRGQQIDLLHPTTGELEKGSVPDELDFDVEQFNRGVITDGFNKVVCEELAANLDPTGKEKTLVFCVNDRHADLFVDLLKQAFRERWGEIDDAAVRKITGRVDKPLEAIRRFKNEELPNTAVTVDLLTTGIDVPRICNLVFVRRVRSRILYEQMLGRATRLCEEIDKSVFRIYDAVDIYRTLEPLTTMKPVVRQVNTTVRQLLAEIVDDRAHGIGGADETRSHGDDALDQLVTKLRRYVREAEKSPSAAWITAAQTLETAFGCPIEQLPTKLKKLGALRLARELKATPGLVDVFARLDEARTRGTTVPIAPHVDQLLVVSRDYRDGNKRPGDYLQEFGKFVIENQNKLPALSVVLSRPRDLTRAQLKELKLKLDVAGFPESSLQTAWREMKNEDIAATIIGFIRQQALGSPLVPYEERVNRAPKKVLASQSWKPPERKWLERIATHVRDAKVVDRASIDEATAFQNHGGSKGVDRALGGRLDQVLTQMSEAIWDDAIAA